MPTYSIVIIVVISAIMLFFICGAIAQKIVSINIYGKRADGSLSIHYSLPSYYKNLNVERSYFLNNKRVRLSVYEYSLKGTNPEKIILFTHGVGAGHFYILRLINYLCEQGFRVIAYDQYASGTSEGYRLESMIQGAIDIKYAIRYVENKYHQNFSLMGHSWGGFCSAQGLRYSKHIDKCLSIAGVDCEAEMINPKLKLRSLVVFIIKLVNSTKYGKYAFYTSSGAFKKTNAKVMYLQGKADLVVLPKLTGYRYQKMFKNKPNIRIEMIDKKAHAPYVDYESQLKQGEVMKQFGLLCKNLVPIEVFVDYEKTSIPDMNVYKLISDFFKD